MTNKIADLLNTKIKAKQTSVASLAKLLCTSRDTLYRKLQGLSAFTIDEVYNLQEYFNFSIDALAPQVPISKKLFTTKEFLLLPTPQQTIENYLDNLLADFGKLGELGIPHLYYAAKDLPLFCFFSSNILTSFKLYIWYITIFDSHATKLKYTPNWIPDALLYKAKQLFSMYNTIHSTEIWNTETLNSTLHQITYGMSIGSVKAFDAKQIIIALNTFIDTLEENAEKQSKLANATFKIYINEILLLDNTVLFEIGQYKIFYLPYQTLNFLSSTDTQFTNNAFEWFAKQTNKSTLISGEALKERQRVMNIYRKAIDKVEKQI